MQQRKASGYSMLEIMVAISLLTVVLSMLYMYNTKGWQLFGKNLSYSKLQIDARAALDQIATNLKKGSAALVYTSNLYNRNVPFPDDAIYNKPYIYFAIPRDQEYKAQEIKDRSSKIQITNFDYYLYYIAKTNSRDGSTAYDRAKLKLLILKDQDGLYTTEHARDWPFVPPKLLGSPTIESSTLNPIIGLSTSKVALQDLTPEFDEYTADFTFNYFGTEYDNLYKLRVNIIDPETKSKVSYETAVSPRN
jgi:prepilin-type N-terminal cleavage/methylation domain-containing protein